MFFLMAFFLISKASYEKMLKICLEDSYEAPRSAFRILGIDKIADTSPATCPLVPETLASQSSKAKDLFYALIVNSILGCSIDVRAFEGIGFKLQSVLKDARSLLDCYYSIGGLVLIKRIPELKHYVHGFPIALVHTILGWTFLEMDFFSQHRLALSPPASTPGFSFSPGFLFTRMQPKQPAISLHCNTTEATLLDPATLMISLKCYLPLPDCTTFT